MSEAKHSDGKITYERLLATYQDRTVARVAFAQLGGQPYHGTRKENDRDYHLDLEYVASAHIAGIIDGPVLAARIAHLEAVNAQLLAACEAVEWKGRESWSPNHISKDGTVCTTWSQGCPCCTRHIETGHAPNCQLAAAIREGRG